MSLLADDEAGVACPAEYPELHVFFDHLEDTRACTECTCTQTAPSACAAWLSLFQDEACTSGLFSTLVESGMPVCNNIQVASPALASLSATWVTNQPGACVASGGEAIGEVEPKSPRTFCCQPPPGE